MTNKIKGVLLVVLGATWIIFVSVFDDLIGKPKGVGGKAVCAFIVGAITVVNGIRIYRRK